MECHYPDNKPTTGYDKGCRCERCVLGNREKSRKAMAKYNRTDKGRASHRRWSAANKDKLYAKTAKDQARRRGAKVDVSPEERKGIEALYAEARRLSIETGIPHDVDHIQPIIKGGLHVLSNLQILTASENRSKGGR